MDVATIRCGELEIIECGECLGCKLKHEQTVLIRQMDDEWFMPRLRRLAERYDPPGSQIKPDPRSYESREIMRERNALLEFRSRAISAVLKDFRYPSCYRVTIRVPVGS